MNLNVRALCQALKNLPAPQSVNEIFNIPVPTLPLDEWRKIIAERNTQPSYEKETEISIILTAKRYCRTQHDCWLEWVIDI